MSSKGLRSRPNTTQRGSLMSGIGEFMGVGQAIDSDEMSTGTSSSSKSSYRRPANTEWKAPLLKLEKYRVKNGHNLDQLFRLLDPLGRGSLPLRDFSYNLTQICEEINPQEASILAHCIDGNRRLEITLQDLQHFFTKQVSELQGLQTIYLDEHPVFPQWLATRDDFQDYFPSTSTGLMQLEPLLKALHQCSEKRTLQDLQIIADWLRQRNFLTNTNRLFEICRHIKLIEVSRGVQVVNRGDFGEQSFIVISGTLEASLDGVVLSVLSEGMLFGSKLDDKSSNISASATITCSSNTQLLTLNFTHFQHLMNPAQAKALNGLVEFLRLKTPCFHNIEIAKLYDAARSISLMDFRLGDCVLSQGDRCINVCVVFKGTVKITRSIDTDRVWHEVHAATGISNPLTEVSGEYSNADIVSSDSGSGRHGILSVTLKTLQPGRVFGDDCLRDRWSNSYSVYAARADTQVVFINRFEGSTLLEDEVIKAKILQLTDELHEEDLNLLLMHESSLRNQYGIKKSFHSHTDPIRGVTAHSTVRSDKIADFSSSPNRSSLRSSRSSKRPSSVQGLPAILTSEPATDTLKTRTVDRLISGIKSCPFPEALGLSVGLFAPSPTSAFSPTAALANSSPASLSSKVTPNNSPFSSPVSVDTAASTPPVMASTTPVKSLSSQVTPTARERTPAPIPQTPSPHYKKLPPLS